MGAGGRDFHNFNVVYRDKANCQVVAFTATQIPNIADRLYPATLAGANYPKGIPVYPEEKLSELIHKLEVTEVVFSYSDVSFQTLMSKASLVLANGADFKLLGPNSTCIESHKPVVSVCAVRTGCGKSQTSRKIAQLLKEMGLRVAVIRHPMPYGDLEKAACQRFKALDDLDHYDCTIEEREEYEPHLKEGHVVFAGVDYERILKAAQGEADVILWDGGNNDFPFYKPDLHIVVVDPHRAGHELTYHPGMTNLLMANVVVINKVDTAHVNDIIRVKENVQKTNPHCLIIEAESPVTADGHHEIKDKKVLAIEDGPTITHGDMGFGAALLAANAFGAKEIVDPRPYAKGSLKKVFESYPHLNNVLPAMGYGRTQIKELEETIAEVPCDLVLIGTPIDLGRILKTRKPLVKISYSFQQKSGMPLEEILKKCLKL